ncbi:MAG: carbohydrate kinase family protein [Lentisphaerae bacterium]|nr:carbohydrate kinase family protein [Lentisphaerota bacterium]
MANLKVAAIGCSLADYLYTDVDFSSEAFKKYSSLKEGDGGLNPGHLVFAEDLEKFSGEDFELILNNIVAGKPFTAFNLGGPAIVALINAAQILSNESIEFEFYGALGEDETADRILQIIAKTPVNTENHLNTSGRSPFTDVLSDPAYHNGKGERTFINNIGSCWDYTPKMVGDSFYDADVLFFGATALVPGIHDNLTDMMKRGKERGCINIVTTVFDFRNEKNNPGQRWPLGDSDEAYAQTDLLIVDWDEAMKLSGKDNLEDAVAFFINKGLKSFFITHGAHDFYVWSNGEFFKKQELQAFPISSAVDDELDTHPEKRGDTTGCGDNFAGGVLTSIASQMNNGVKPGQLEISDTCAWAAASGGFACFCIGGTFHEENSGQKRSLVEPFYNAYFDQVAVK